MVEAIETWLDISGEGSGDVRSWLRDGAPLNPETVNRIKAKLRDSSFSNKDLYGVPICRLVNRNQLRYERHHKIIYQLTPGQLQTMKYSSIKELPEVERIFGPDQPGKREIRAQLARQNQSLYWGVSDLFKSLIAMFDSDMGKNHFFEKDKKIVTKSFINISGEVSKGDNQEAHLDQRANDIAEEVSKAENQEPYHKIGPLSPWMLNLFSPMRYWSPPTTFAKNVFHMLFWRSIITGRDLYGRSIGDKKPEEKLTPSHIQQRIDAYLVIINWFQSSKYRITDYENLFMMVNEIANTLYNSEKPQGEKASDEKVSDILNKKLSEKVAVNIDDAIFFPMYKKGNNSYSFLEMEWPDVKIGIDFNLNLSDVSAEDFKKRLLDWDLFSPYKQVDDKTYVLRHVLQFLRDKLLELVLWSMFQAEIRSVGWVPVQHLYKIELKQACRDRCYDLAEMYEHAVNSSAEIREELFGKIDDSVIELIMTMDEEEPVELVKIFSGPLEAHTDWASIESLIHGLPTMRPRGFGWLP